jgi:hypothetical protein
MSTNDHAESFWRNAAGSASGVWTELKTNRRAAGGLIAILLLALGYGLFGLADANSALQGTYTQEVLRLQRTIVASDEKDWPERAKASAAMRETLEKRLWKAESEGVALANVQDWVTSAGRDAGIDRLQVKLELSKPKGLPADYRRLTATITAQQTEATLAAFLDRIQRDPHMLVVDQLHVQVRPVQSLEMTLVTYAKLTGSNAAAHHE